MPEISLNSAALRALETEASLRVATRAAELVLAEAKRLCPVSTGALRDSITVLIEGSFPETLVAKIGSNLPYALDVEEGTGSPIEPHGRFLVFPGRGGVVFATAVSGQKPQPYLAPALDVMHLAFL